MKNILKYFFKILCFIICFFIITICINLIINKFIFISNYKINSENIPHNFDGYKIMQLTDIHSIRNFKQKEKLLKKVRKQNPDVIFITGDLIDATYYGEENTKTNKFKNDVIPDLMTVEFVSELTDIAEVYFVYGNHEMMLLDDPVKNSFKVALEDLGVHIINNKIETIEILGETIRIIGIQDPATLYKDKTYAYIGENNQEKTEYILNDLFVNLKENDMYTILLSHRPEYFDLYSKYPINLVFTGHAHGGVIRIPFLGGLYAHSQGWFPKYTSGMYENNEMTMIVGRGIGDSQFPIRIWNPPEIITVTLNR